MRRTAALKATARKRLKAACAVMRDARPYVPPASRIGRFPLNTPQRSQKGAAYASRYRLTEAAAQTRAPARSRRCGYL